ncbi:MAG: acetyl-CoA carboxylase biotin carboxyl carrier protein subunit [bacterium]
MEIIFLINNKKFIATNHNNKTKINNKTFETQIIKWNPNSKILFFQVDQQIFKSKLINVQKSWLELFVYNLNKTIKIYIDDYSKFIPAQKSDPEVFQNSIFSPISGRIVKVNVKENEPIKKNQVLLIIESMKMENEIRAKMDAFIKTILIMPGDLVKQDQILIKLEKRGKKNGTTKIKNAKTPVSNR